MSDPSPSSPIGRASRASTASPPAPGETGAPVPSPRTAPAADPARFASATGERLALLGREIGPFEAWIWPLRVATDVEVRVRPLAAASEGERTRSGHVPAPPAPGLTAALADARARGAVRIETVAVAPGELELGGVGAAGPVLQAIAVARAEPLCVWRVHLVAAEDLLCELVLAPDFRPSWPSGLGGRIAARDAETGALALTEERGRFAALVGAQGALPLGRLPERGLASDPLAIRVRVSPERAAAGPVDFVLAGAAVEPPPLSDAARRGEDEAARGRVRTAAALAAARALWTRGAERPDSVAAGAREHARAFRASVVRSVSVPATGGARETPAASGGESSAPEGRRETAPGCEALAESGGEVRAASGGEVRAAGIDPPARHDAALANALDAIDGAWVATDDLGRLPVAGLAPAGAGHRPGFAWFFPGDALCAARALALAGDHAGARAVLAFVARHQAPGGKVPHEITLSAALCEWFDEYPYAFYKADSTPAFPAALDLYLRASGDRAFAAELLPAAARALDWCDARRDERGLLSNELAGLAAVEAGALSRNVRAEAYLNGLWLAGLAGLASAARRLGETGLAERAAARLAAARAAFEGFWCEAPGRYAFAWLRDGRACDEPTPYTAVALAEGLVDERRAARTALAIAHPRVTADWGTRMFPADSALYAPEDYNTGSVFPYLTNFAVLALYRAGIAPAAHALLASQVALDGFSQQGCVPEHLVGDVCRAPARGVPHQIFSSSTIVESTLAGLWGFAPDAPRDRLTLAPSLPADQDALELANLAAGDRRLAVRLVRERAGGASALVLEARLVAGPPLALAFAPRLAPHSRVLALTVDGRPRAFETRALAGGALVVESAPVRLEERVRVRLEHEAGPDLALRPAPHAPGAASADLRLGDVVLGPTGLRWRLYGRPGLAYRVVFACDRPCTVRGATRAGAELEIAIPAESSAGGSAAVAAAVDFAAVDVEVELDDA